MPKFIIRPHFRLREWVAEEKGHFAAQGLDYEFREQMKSDATRNHHLGNKVGDYQLYEQDSSSNVSCPAHRGLSCSNRRLNQRHLRKKFFWMSRKKEQGQ